VVWKFDDSGHMQPTFSSPCLSDGRLYIGEGMHRNFTCKLYCLDAATGRKHWHFEAAGHIESSPCVATGRVYFGAGDDGLYCLDVRTGKQLWHFQEEVHVDASPAVADGRVFAASGVSLSYRKTEAFGLDARTGAVLWRVPTDLPVWGSPALEGDEVLFGLANGRLVKPPPPPESPAGGVLCVGARSGRVAWRRPLNAVFCRPAVDADGVWVGCRDGCCYRLDRRTGQVRWKTDLGSPVVARPALLGGRVYAVSSGGRVCRLDADTGEVGAAFDLAAHTRTRPRIVSSPAVVPAADGGCRLYVGTELANEANSAATLYCLRD
jgi:outer membrane protein assembly factor BamB